MAEPVEPGTWVEIASVVLTPEERAPQVPADTRRVPLELRAKGHLTAPARPGGPATVVTAAGRRLTGTLVAVNPPYEHGFGAPIPELLTIGRELRELLDGARDA